MTTKLAKGYATEEFLRRYFIQSGYYTVRGVPFTYKEFDVTDIDLWLYVRPSPLNRQRIIVDCKNKSTPKVIERIFWVKGLQAVLGVEQAVVATTDSREAVMDFGREHNVLILDGRFLSRLQQATEGSAGRLSEEDLESLLSSYQPSNSKGDWRNRYKALKAPFAQNLGYNAINYWSEEGRYFCEQALVVRTHQQVAIRMVYLIISYICIAFDFAMRDVSFLSATERIAAITDGLKHGAQGSTNFKVVLSLATSLIEQLVPESRAVAYKLRDRVEQNLSALPAQALAEHFAKQAVSQELFTVGKEFDGCAYSSDFVPAASLSSSAKGILSAFLDYWGIKRSKFYDAANNSSTEKSPVISIRASNLNQQESLPGIIESGDYDATLDGRSEVGVETESTQADDSRSRQS